MSQLLREEFCFRCIEVKKIQTRNRLEEVLVATLSLCRVCNPSAGWLGRYAYSDLVKESGLWNANYVFDAGRLMSDADLRLLDELAH